jgi:hypothetical protein
MTKFKKGDIILWENIRFKVLSYNEKIETGTVQCLQNVKGVWKYGDITENFAFYVGDCQLLVKQENELSELEYLRLFYSYFNNSSELLDIIYNINDKIKKITKKRIPEKYDIGDDNE